MFVNIETCVTNDGRYLYVIGGSALINNIRQLADTVYKYTPPISGKYTSNVLNDTWELMGNMRYKLSSRGCTTDKSSKYLYLIGGDMGTNDYASFGEYIDLNEYEVNGFDESYYFMGNIIDREFRNNSITWWSLNCFSSSYAEDIIYCMGGQLNESSAYNEIWMFERFYKYVDYGSIGNNIRSNPELYGCTKKSNNYSVPYLFYPACAGAIGHNIKSVLGNGYPSNEVNAQASRTIASGCHTPWYLVNNISGDYAVKFYLGGTQSFGPSNEPATNGLIIQEDLESFFITSVPTNIPTNLPTNITETPSMSPTTKKEAFQLNLFVIVSTGIASVTIIVALVGIIHAKCIKPNDLFRISMVILPFFYLYVKLYILQYIYILRKALIYRIK